MSRRILLTAVALGWAAGAVQFARDYRAGEAAECPAAPGSAPPRSQTLARQAVACLGDIRLGQARDLARQALARQSSNAAALAVLGSADELDHKMASADRWMTLASRFGHRNYFVEMYWINRLAGRDLAGTARHIDAFLRADWQSDAVRESARALEATPEGREALLDRLGARPDWGAAFLRDVHRLTDGEFANRRLLLGAMAEAHAGAGRPLPVEAEALMPAVRESYSRGQIAEAYTLRAVIPPFDRGQPINDGSFAASHLGLDSPFDWAFPHRTGLSATPERDGGLRVRGDDPGRYVVARQWVRLAPGTYRVTVAVSGDEPGARFGPDLLVRISGRDAAPVQTTRLDRQDRSGNRKALVTLAGDSPFHRLQLVLDVPAGSIGLDFTVRSIAVSPMAPAQ